MGLTQSNLMDLCLLSRSVVGVELNFDNSKDIVVRGPDETPVRAPKALVLILEILL